MCKFIQHVKECRRNNMKRILCLIPVLVIFWSCSGSLPDWYENRSDYYPENEYIVSKGWGKTPEEAIEKAAINMAQIFNTKVTVEENILRRYESISDMKDFEEYLYEFSEKTATLISEQNLVNIMFVEPVYERKSRSFYTLAYMPRVETAKILMDRMKREEGKTEYYVMMAQSAHDPVRVYRYYTAAWLTAGRIKMMQEQLDLLAPGIGTAPIYGFESLAVMKDNAAKRLVFGISVQGDGNGRIEQALRQSVNRAGFPVADREGELRILAEIGISAIDIDQKPLVFVSWEMKLNVIDGKQQTIISLMKEGREGSTNEPNARLHVYESVQRFIEDNLSDRLQAYLDRPEE